VCVCVRVNVHCNKDGEKWYFWAPVVCVCTFNFLVFKGVA
jgi:hypothetical protein